MTDHHVDKNNGLFSGAFPSFIGLVLPIFIGFFSIPFILNRMGVERFGALTVIWAIVGYSGLFDLGISRALTHSVAASSNSHVRARTIRSGLTLLLMLGVGGMLLLWLMSWVAMSAGLLQSVRENILSSFYLGLGMPFLMVGQGLRGVLEGLQRFSASAWGRIVNGVMTFGAPMPLLAMHSGLDLLVLALCFGRMVTMIMQVGACKNELIQAWFANSEKGDKTQLLRTGGWMMVPNILSPLMLFVDRLVVSTTVYAPALAYYTIPIEAVSRLLTVPGAIGTAIFPRLVKMQASDKSVAFNAMLTAMMLTMLILAPMVVGLQLFSIELLNIWLGSEFARKGSTAMQLIALGVFAIGVAQFPYIYLQSIGKSDYIAKAHFLEFPAYILCLVFMLNMWGINGVACAWVLRSVIDLILLGVLSFMQSHSGEVMRLSAVILGALALGAFCFAFDVENHSIADRSVCLLLMAMACAFFASRLVNQNRVKHE